MKPPALFLLLLLLFLPGCAQSIGGLTLAQRLGIYSTVARLTGNAKAATVIDAVQSAKQPDGEVVP